MKLSNPVHPSEFLYDMLLDAPKALLQITNYDLFKDIVLNKKDLTEQNCEFLAKVFQTSKEYWMNLQKQWDEANAILETDQPCPDVSISFDDYLTGPFAQVHDEGRPVSVEVYDNQKVYIVTEQAYKYMLAKCTKDEMWDLGFLGQSEKHVKKSKLPNFKFNEKLDHGAFISDDYSQGVLDLETMNKNPKQFATHCLISDPSCLVIQSTETCRQLLFIDNSWQPSDIYHKLLKPLN